MSLEEILNENFADSEIRKKDFANWYVAIEMESRNYGKTLEAALKNKKFLIRSFYVRRVAGISRANYYKYKEYLSMLGIASEDVPTQDEVWGYEDRIVFFRDLQDLLGLIDKVGGSMWNDYDAKADLAFLKSIVILGWYGFNVSEIATLRMDNLKAHETTYRIEAGAKTVEIAYDEYSILKYAAVTEMHRGMPGGQFRGYPPTGFIIRQFNTKSEIGKIEFYIINLLRRFNDKAMEFGYGIVFRNLLKNALFVKVYNLDSAKYAHRTIATVFNCADNAAYALEREYRLWRNKYYSKKEDI